MIPLIRLSKNRVSLLLKPKLKSTPFKSTTFIISKNKTNSNLFIASQNNNNTLKRFYSGNINNNNNNNSNNSNNNITNDNDKNKKEENFEEHVFHDRDEFSKDPKFFYVVSLIVTAGLIYNFYQGYIYFATEDILDEVRTILNSDDALERNTALGSIASRASLVYCIEKLFHLGVVEVLVKSLNDPDPIVQLTAIKTLDKFFNTYHYEVFGDEAVKRGACQALARIILSNGMNSDAASGVWLRLLLSKNNQVQVLASNELLYCLQTLAYSDNLEFQRVAIATIKILFVNRDVYPMLLKLKGMLSQLHKSQDILISNHAEYFLNVLKGELIPPVGDVSFKFEELNIGHKMHGAINLLMVPFTYLYCCLRWRRHSRDPIYWRTKGLYGGVMVFLASTVSTLLLYPDFHPNIIDDRLKKGFSLGPKTLEEFDRCKEQLQQSAVLLVDQKDEDPKSEDNKEITKNKESKEIVNSSEESSGFKQDFLFTPNSLYVMKQASPILTYFILLMGWKHARYIVVPSIALLVHNLNNKYIKVTVQK
ncbi:hypothetical protein DICPUDRAFT_155806 [Dictyostelium purpureum]|uniref:Armadillo repeat-containing domain-containing protein n=1 Tax=Dictyostelium purpureum TaxID=5786 RepID=F0ZUX9_DICPU|nr:uncharacterized protein DICPUDRAFT_155806 [Dictyostelium purpureum]EGC32257.1 hypothetical protein DICPUDRAFT_155806 [Dictyostelium purpureum]|eukprot:XP_003291224.1 hypothetical protein DICPUDRAFT_155806 [Dictyostelium purpureum]